MWSRGRWVTSIAVAKIRKLNIFLISSLFPIHLYRTIILTNIQTLYPINVHNVTNKDRVLLYICVIKTNYIWVKSKAVHIKKSFKQNQKYSTKYIQKPPTSTKIGMSTYCCNIGEKFRRGKSPIFRLLVQQILQITTNVKSKFWINGLCEENPPVSDGFPLQIGQNYRKRNFGSLVADIIFHIKRTIVCLMSNAHNLIYWGCVTHIRISRLYHHWFR